MGQSRSYEYEAIGASQPNYRLTAEGGTGDYLRSLIVSITNAVTGTVTIRDGDGPTIPIVPTGTAVGTYVVPIKAVSNTGRWSVTTGAGATVIAVHQATPRIPVAWTIADVFSSGEIGVHYDPSDLSTIFQDHTGTIPGAVGSVVGLMLDKSQGLVLGPELVTNGGFDTADGWALGAGWSISGGVLIATAAAVGTVTTRSIATTVGRYYKITYTTSVVSGSVAAYPGVASASIKSVSGTYTEYFVATSTSTSIGVQARVSAFTGTVDNISVRELPGYHAYQTSAGSKPILRQDANGHYYLEFDGVDDFLVTPSIDFTGTDKMFVCAGVRRQGAVLGIPIELSTGNLAGSFYIADPYSGASELGFVLKGATTTSAYTADALATPATEVVSVRCDIAGATIADEIKPRVNGVTPTLTVVAAGPADASNFGNYPIYIGRRAGTTLPFNGYLYGLVIAGMQATDSQVAQTENYMNARTGAY